MGAFSCRRCGRRGGILAEENDPVYPSYPRVLVPRVQDPGLRLRICPASARRARGQLSRGGAAIVDLPHLESPERGVVSVWQPLTVEAVDDLSELDGRLRETDVADIGDFDVVLVHGEGTRWGGELMYVDGDCVASGEQTGGHHLLPVRDLVSRCRHVQVGVGELLQRCQGFSGHEQLIQLLDLVHWGGKLFCGVSVVGAASGRQQDAVGCMRPCQ